MGEEEGVEDTNMIVLCYEFSYSNAVCARCVPHDAYKEAMHYPRARVYLYVLVSSRYYDVYITSGGGVCDTYKRVREEITMRGTINRALDATCSRS